MVIGFMQAQAGRLVFNRIQGSFSFNSLFISTSGAGYPEPVRRRCTAVKAFPKWKGPWSPHL